MGNFWIVPLLHSVSDVNYLRSVSTPIHMCHAMPTPRPCRAPTTPFWKRLLKVTTQHGRGAAWARHGKCEITSAARDCLWATCPVSASSGYHAEFHKVFHQDLKLKCRWPVWNQAMYVMDEEKPIILVQEHECCIIYSTKITTKFSEQQYMKTLHCHFFHVCKVMFIIKYINMLLMLKELPLMCLVLTQHSVRQVFVKI